MGMEIKGNQQREVCILSFSLFLLLRIVVIASHTMLPIFSKKDFLKTLDNVQPDSGGFLFIRQEKFRESFAQDVDGTEAHIMAVVQKLPNQSIFAEKS
jgi:hypothetical protein